MLFRSVGTHGVKHRAATDIANSGVPVKVGMALTAHKTVTMFMRYVHTEDDPTRNAADLVAARRKGMVEEGRIPAAAVTLPQCGFEIEMPAAGTAAPTAAVAYRPFRHRLTEGRAIPPGSKRAETLGQGREPEMLTFIAQKAMELLLLRLSFEQSL